MDDATRQKITDLVNGNKVVLFMKGTRHFPQCGFSGALVQVLNANKATYETVNVLADPAIRQGVKDFASWPTVPQVYVGGKFLGGCDIVRDMFTSGELEPLVREAAQK